MGGQGKKHVKRHVILAAMAFSATISVAWLPGSPLFLPGAGVWHFLLFFLLYAFFLQATRRLSAAGMGPCLFGGVVLGLCMACGGALAGGGGMWQILAMWPGFALIFCAAMFLLFHYANEKNSQGPAHGSMARFFDGLTSGHWPRLYIIVLLLWLPYYVLCFPGLVTLDSMGQMEMWFGGAVFSSHHPPLHTAFIGGCMQLGRAVFGNMAAGVALAAAVQMLCTAALVVLVIKTMSLCGISPHLRFVAFCFYAVLPLCGLYAITLWKDIWLANFVLLFVLCLAQVVRQKGDFFKNPAQVAMLIFACLGMLLSKNSGVYVALISLAVAAVMQKTCRLQFLALFLGVLLAQGVISGPLYSAMGVAKGDPREALSLPLMQISRVVAYNSANISGQDADIINEVLPYNELKGRYKNWISDDVKLVFNTAVFKKAPMRYVGLWLRLGLANPGQYALATLEHTQGYWYPDVEHWIFAYNTYPAELRAQGTNLNGQEAMAGLYKEPFAQGIGGLLLVLAAARHVPVFGMMYSIGFYFWAILIAGLYAIYTKQKEKLMVLVPLFVVWLTCLASPVYAEFRYAWPAIFCVPFIVGWCFTKRGNA